MERRYTSKYHFFKSWACSLSSYEGRRHSKDKTRAGLFVSALVELTCPIPLTREDTTETPARLSKRMVPLRRKDAAICPWTWRTHAVEGTRHKVHHKDTSSFHTRNPGTLDFPPPSPKTGKQEGDKTGKKLLRDVFRRSVMSDQTLEVSLLGVGTVLRLDRNAWSMVKRLRQATHEYAPPPSPSFTNVATHSRPGDAQVLQRPSSLPHAPSGHSRHLGTLRGYRPALPSPRTVPEITVVSATKLTTDTHHIHESMVTLIPLQVHLRFRDKLLGINRG